MDDIYDDLDNYEDLNIVEELKKENHDLKLKLEEYTIAMSKLQKDFDQLSSDFKKLEMNYSSLLKTAKVEIERKTKIITDLNIEKDMMVLNVLQKRHGNDVKKLKSMKPFTKEPSNDSSLSKARSNIPLAENIKGKNSNSGRTDDIRFSSVDTTTTSGNTDIASKLMEIAHKTTENVELWSDRTSDTKENITLRNKNAETNNKPSNTQALSIKNRRKSMPAVRSNANYSSDDEYRGRYCLNDANKKASREDPNRQNIDRVHSDRHRYKGLEDRNKPSEMSYVDDQYYGYPGTSRDSYHRSKNDRHWGTDKYRTRNKYDHSSRYRKHFSPERSWRPSRNDDYQRQEHGRYRVLESPPPDKFQHYQQRNQETRFKRDRDDSYELERRDNNFDKYSSKHKTNSEHYIEPISKKQRKDSLNQFSEEELRWSRERPLEKPIMDLYENLHHNLSCQSPDHIITDAISSYPIREIMNTALTPLEDPRIHSKRYILKSSDNNMALSTVVGRNIDLKLLDISRWNNTPEAVTNPSTRKPSQCSEDIVKEIYMDIDNPISNMSTESGEILSFDAEDNVDELRKNPSISNIQRHEKNVGTESVKLPDKNDDKNSISKYKIPKVKRNESENKFSASHDLCVRQSQNKTEQPRENLKNNQKCKKVPEHDLDKKTPIEKEYKSEIPISKNNDNGGHCEVNYKEIYTESISSMNELVAGDLELSDETCDNVESQKKSSRKPQTKDKCSTDNENKNKFIVPLQNKVTSQNIILDKNLEKEITQEKSSDSVQDDCKKRNSKKKLPKNKETPKTAKADTTDKETDKKVKPKRDTKDSKEIKTKFTELFGDSSSLITPEDLGIMAMQAQTQSSAAYVPICEDAQHAVDITVPKVEKVQTRLSKLKSLETAHRQECLDTEKNDVNKTEIKTKISQKSSIDNKKKSRKNTAEVRDNSKIREVYQSLTADKLVTENDVSPQNLAANEEVKQIGADTIADEPVAKQIVTTIVQEPCQRVSENIFFSMEPQLADEPTTTAPNVPQKTNILMRALATSTPQKDIQQDKPEIAIVVGPNSSKETSYDNVADKSSTNETMTSQNDADVPDVRIFVRRKRRVKISK